MRSAALFTAAVACQRQVRPVATIGFVTPWRTYALIHTTMVARASGGSFPSGDPVQMPMANLLAATVTGWAVIRSELASAGRLSCDRQ